MSDPETGPESEPETRPALRIIRGDATPEEVAALVAVVTGISAAAAAATAGPRPRSEWASPARMVRRPVTAGRGAWRASALPF